MRYTAARLANGGDCYDCDGGDAADRIAFAVGEMATTGFFLAPFAAGAALFGAPGADTAYVFVRSGATWSQQAYLKAPSPGVVDEFRQNSLEFMQNMANTDIGGFFSIMRL